MWRLYGGLKRAWTAYVFVEKMGIDILGRLNSWTTERNSNGSVLA